jgi:hypothetical protein
VTDCTTTKIEFSSLKRRKVEAEFSGGEITSDGGALLLRAADQQLGLMKRISDVIEDPRRQELVQHSQLSMLRQRAMGLHWVTKISMITRHYAVIVQFKWQ